MDIGIAAPQADSAGLRRHRLVDGTGAGEDRVPAVRAHDRSMALARVPTASITPDRLQRRMVASCASSYQGIRRAERPRPADAFDPGAKYHIANNVPYLRYFLAYVLQFQFYEAPASRPDGKDRCIAARCTGMGKSARGSTRMLEMGTSQPWPDALEAFTGTRANGWRARWCRYFEPLDDLAAGTEPRPHLRLVSLAHRGGQNGVITRKTPADGRRGNCLAAVSSIEKLIRVRSRRGAAPTDLRL